MFFWRGAITARGGGEDPPSVSSAENNNNNTPDFNEMTGGDLFRVRVPDNVRPGDAFQVFARNRIVRVRCPPDSSGGSVLQLRVPRDASSREDIRPDAPSSPPRPRAGTSSAGAGSGGGAANDAQDRLQYVVAVPPGVRPNRPFPVMIGERRLTVVAPSDPDQRSLRVALSSSGRGGRGDGRVQAGARSDCPPVPRPRRSRPASRSVRTRLFEVVVPRGVAPGAPFSLMAEGNRVLVTCPPEARPGQRIRFEMPLGSGPGPGGGKKPCPVADFRMTYNKDGWMRVVRVRDLKFQWVRMDDGNVDEERGFDIEKSAFVRSFRPREGNGRVLELVPAAESAVESSVKREDGRDLVALSDIVAVQAKPFEEKDGWFRDTCDRLKVDWAEGHIQLRVRRPSLLADSMDAILSLPPRDLRKTWRFEFLGEDGIDAGGLSREWFQLVSGEIFDPDRGMWKNCLYNQTNMEINPGSDAINPDDYGDYYRFVGRVLGKALFDGQVVPCHLARHLYKHLLGWPVAFADLKYIDEDIYRSLPQLLDMEDVEDMCLTLTCTEEVLGCNREVELLEGGSGVDVTNENLVQYLELSVKHKLLGRVRSQLGELLRGFYEVIPETLLTVFDFQELELLMCGVPRIDMKDWRGNTEYEGLFEAAGGDHPACRWFWHVVADFDGEMKARLLQFVTGTSGVPARGFAALRSFDGNLRKFTINGVPSDRVYPVAHTCFNRVDLPRYESKQILRERLELAIAHSLSPGAGFHRQ